MEKIIFTAIVIASSILKSESRSHINAASFSNSLEKEIGCHCHFGNKPTVPEILFEKETITYERLVIYLYKNTETNELLIHIPDNKKQKYLPDINYEKKDILKTVAEERVVEIFLNHQNHFISGRVKHDSKNPFTPEFPTTTLNIDNSKKIPEHELTVTTLNNESEIPSSKMNPIISAVKKYPKNINKIHSLKISSPKNDHNQKNAFVTIPKLMKESDSKIYYYYPDDVEHKHPTKNGEINKLITIKEHNIKGHRDHIHDSDIIPVNIDTKPSTFIVKDPDYVPSHAIYIDEHTPPLESNKVKILYNKQHDIGVKIPKTKYNNSQKHPASSKTSTINHSYHKKDKPIHNVRNPSNFHKHFIVGPIMKGQTHKHPTGKPVSQIHQKNPSNVKNSKEKNKNSTPKTSYETISGVIMNYPEFAMSHDGKGSKSKPTKVKRPNVNGQNKITIDVPRNRVKAPSDERVPILRIPTSRPEIPNHRNYHTDDPLIPTNENYYEFDDDTGDIFYKEPAKDIYFPELIPKKDGSKSKDNKNILLCDYCKQNIKHKDINHKPPEVSVYIPEHIPTDRGPIIIDVLKPKYNKPTCQRCKQNKIHKPDNMYNLRSDSSLTPGQKTFDQWFREEMYGFRQNEDIDVDWVGKYIVKILNDHGMHVSKKGLLADSKGKVFPLQNLKLRAMLVGDSVSLNTIWKSSGSKGKTPEYLAFVILMTIDPPTTLGIIPLGKTLPFSTASLKSLSNVLKSNQIGGTDQLSGYNYINPNPKGKVGRYTKRSSNKYDESVDRFLRTMPHHSPAFNDDVYQNAEDNNATFDNHATEKNKHNHDYINSEDLYGNENMLRIIGGSAATGSGTPVSSKGKSIKLDD